MRLNQFTAALPLIGGALALARRAEDEEAPAVVPNSYILEYSQVRVLIALSQQTTC